MVLVYTELPYVRRSLVRRFLSFLKMIKKCDKPAIMQLLDVVKSDVRLTTGHNIRHIMLQAGLETPDELLSRHVDVSYHEIVGADRWRVDLLKEVVDVIVGDMDLLGFEKEELKEIRDYICTQ